MKKLVPALAVLMLFPLALMAATPAPGYVTFEREYRYAAEKTDNLAT